MYALFCAEQAPVFASAIRFRLTNRLSPAVVNANRIYVNRNVHTQTITYCVQEYSHLRIIRPAVFPCDAFNCCYENYLATADS